MAASPSNDSMPGKEFFTWCHQDGGDKATDVCLAPRPPLRSEAMVQNQFKQDLTCPLCKDVLVQGVFLTPCGHTFCQECIKNANQDDERRLCPTCQELMKDEAPNLHARNMVASLQYLCRYRLSYNLGSEEYEVIPSGEDDKEAFCQAKLKAEEIAEHESGCECALEPCKWRAEGCEFVGRQGEVEEHQGTCTFQNAACSFCQAVVPFEDKERHQSEDCPEVEDKCSNAKYGCKAQPKRSALAQHLADSCLHEKVRPDFEAMARNLDDMQGDLGVLKYETLTEAVTLKDLQDKFAELEESVQFKDGKIQKLKDELNGLRNTLTQRREEINALRGQLAAAQRAGFIPRTPLPPSFASAPSAPVLKKQKKVQQQRSQEKKPAAVSLKEGTGTGAEAEEMDGSSKKGIAAEPTRTTVTGDAGGGQQDKVAGAPPVEKKTGGGAQGGQKRRREEKGKQGQTEGPTAGAPKMLKKICKFFPSCKMSNCRFLHVDGGATANGNDKIEQGVQMERVPPPVPKQPKKVSCKYYPACYNANCPFLHPGGRAHGSDMIPQNGRPGGRAKQGGPRPPSSLQGGPRPPSSLPQQSPASHASPRPMFGLQGHQSSFSAPAFRFETLGPAPVSDGPPGFRFGDPVPVYFDAPTAPASGGGGLSSGGGFSFESFGGGGGNQGAGGVPAHSYVSNLFAPDSGAQRSMASDDVVKNIRDLALSFVTEQQQQQQQRPRQTGPMLGGMGSETYRREPAESRPAGGSSFVFGAPDRIKSSWDLDL